jgi:hypothetical protein
MRIASRKQGEASDEKHVEMSDEMHDREMTLDVDISLNQKIWVVHWKFPIFSIV